MSSSDELPVDSPSPQPPPELPVEPPALVVARPSYLSPRSKPPQSPAPRFGTAHLMLYVSCVAVFLSIIRARAGQPPGVVGIVIACASAAAVGAAWAGLLIFVSRRVRRVGWPIEPGEWLVAVLGAGLAVQMLLYLTSGMVFRLREVVADAVMCCLLVVPTFSRKLPAAWKALFISLVLLYAFKLVVIWMGLIAADRFARAVLQLPLPLSIVAVCIVAAWRLPTGPRYGWLHWAGIAIWIWFAAQMFLFHLLL